jgi:hypothetical protein
MRSRYKPAMCLYTSAAMAFGAAALTALRREERALRAVRMDVDGRAADGAHDGAGAD